MKINNLLIKYLLIFSSIILTTSCSSDDDKNSVPGTFSLIFPTNASTNVSILPTLTWGTSVDADGDDVTYNLYTGESKSSLTLLTNGLTSASYTITNELENNTTYYWKVESTDGTETATSSIRSFTTAKIAVLIIYDDSKTSANKVALSDAITNSGAEVTFSDVSETAWNNTNPSIDNFDAVIHLNGTTYGTEMPVAGQEALLDFVKNKGGYYIGFEWNNYEIYSGRMEEMEDLVLTVRGSGNSGNVTYEVVSDQSSHPVLEGISDFTFSSSSTNGTVRIFTEYPSVVLMKDGNYDGVIVREFDQGKVLGFNDSADYTTAGASLTNENIQDIIINFINWK